MKKHYVSYVGKKSEGTICAGGKVYDEIEVRVSCFGSSIVDRLAMTVYEDKKKVSSLILAKQDIKKN